MSESLVSTSSEKPFRITPECSYDLSEGQSRRVLREDLRGLKIKPRSLKVIRVADNRSGLANVARSKEADLFGKSFGNSPEDMHTIYGEHEAQSRFYMVVTAEDNGEVKTVGVLRAIEGPLEDSITAKTIPEEAKTEEFKLNNIFNGKALSAQERVWDIGTVAIDEDYRKRNGKGKGKTGLLLYRSLYGDMIREGGEYMTAMMDYRLLNRLATTGVPIKSFQGVRPEFEYYGSKRTSAVIGHVPEFRKSVLDWSLGGEKSDKKGGEGPLARMAIFLFLLFGEKVNVESY